MLEVLQWSLVVWAVIKVIDVVVELFPFLGGDGIQPYDLTWWVCRPFSFRGVSLIRFPMLIGVTVWLALIVGTIWAVESLFI